MPLPGGYDRYLEALRRLADNAPEAPLPKAEFTIWAADRLGITPKSAQLRVSFLQRVGFLSGDSAGVAVPEPVKAWLRDRDATPLLVKMHRAVQYIGEMLQALNEPITTAGLLAHANEQYLMGWQTNHQIDHRRGWLQSAGLVGCRDATHLYRTDAETAFLDLVVVEPPLARRPVDPTAQDTVTERANGRHHDAGKHRSVPRARVPWERRTKAVDGMPGGVNKYFEAIRWTATQVRENSLSPAALMDRMASHFSISDEYARLSVGFLRKLGLLHDKDNVCVLPDVMQVWLRDDDPMPLMVILHQEVRFIGEMLAALEVPRKTSELHQWANDQYQMGWKSRGQIGLRRAWLQSAGFVRLESNRLRRTALGTAFLDLVVVEAPFETTPSSSEDGSMELAATLLARTKESRRDEMATVLEQLRHHHPVTDLAARIVSSSTDSSKPTRFEEVVQEAFQFLGFDAKHLGGPGKTDVLLQARFGAEAGYRVVVDAKTTSHSALPTQQVVFDTLEEHREKHNAQFAMVVGPNPSAEKLVERARKHGVPVMSAETLAELCKMHASQPLGLAAYRRMFLEGGAVDTSRIESQAESERRLVSLAKWLVEVLAEDTRTLGPMTATGLRISMHHRRSEELPTGEEIEAVLASLASPLVGAIQGDPDNGYVLACSPVVTAERLRILGTVLSAT